MTGYDTYEYGLKFNYSTPPTISASKITNFQPAVITPWSTPAENGVNDFIWNGTFTGSTPDKVSVNTITNVSYSKGMFMHISHPLLQNGAIAAETIVSNGQVGMPKTAPLRSTDSNGKKQTPFRLLKTINKAGVLGLRSTIKTSFSPEDQYLLGGYSCGSFLYLSPLNLDSLVVNAPNKNGKKIIPGGSANSISVDLVFQYRMTDYYGVGDTGTGRVGGILDNTLTNLTYSKKIGIDILGLGKTDFQFDVEVYAKYTTQGKNINNITSTMLSNYATNYNTGNGYGGRRKYLTDNTVNFSYPDINMY